MDIVIRNAEERDLQDILHILNHEIVNTTVVYYYQERTLEQMREWFTKKQEDGMPVLVGEVGQKVLGYASFGIFRPWDAYRLSIEHSIYTKNEARGKGIGRQLMLHLIEIAKSRGFHTMIAGVDASNEGSYKFHKRMGFKEVGRFNEVGYKFDRWLDLIFMQLFLN